MQRFWWVNHKQTFLHERGGGYLWSPKQEATGARSQFYDNMRRARAGDQVLSYADRRIRAVGRVAVEALNAPKPTAFGRVGQYWSDAGWLLPVSWRDVVNEIKPATHLEALIPLLPSKYSPLNPATGRGNQKAYLAEISERLFLTILDLVGGYVGYGDPPLDASTMVLTQEESQVRSIYEDLALSATERMRLVAARAGQGDFRARLVAKDRVCAVTGVADPRVLRASHIKPWRLCESAAERLDECNGLLLTPTFDQMFDQGLLTFLGNGAMRFSTAISADEIAMLGARQGKALYSLMHHEPYLEYHRREIFVA